MGAPFQPNSSSKRSRRSPLSEINVTPFVDVMLVLLIIFMVTAPLMTVGVPVNLPKSKANALNDNVEPLIITIDSKGEIYLQDINLPLDGLVTKLKAVLAGKADTRVFIRGDAQISYGRIVEVMGTLTSAGIDKVSLMAQLPERTS